MVARKRAGSADDDARPAPGVDEPAVLDDAVEPPAAVDEPAAVDDAVVEPSLADTQPVEVGEARAGARLEDEHAALVARLAALESENARLRVAVAATPSGPVTAALPEAPVRRRNSRARAAAAVVLIVIGALLAPVAIAITWAKETITDTDRYLATVAPLADDPAIQAAVTNRITGAIVDAINLDELVSNATSAVADLGLPPRVASLVEGLDTPIVNATTNFIHTQVAKIVQSDAFSTAWTEANRAAQEQLMGVLRGDPDAIASIDSRGTLNVNLTTVINSVKQTLAANGFTIVNSIPTINASFPLVQNSDLVKLKNAYRVLDVLGTWLPWLVVALLAAGVLTAYHRARALVAAGLAFAGAMLLTGLAIGIGRTVYVNSLPSTIQRRDAALNVYDQVVSFLKLSVRTGFVLGLVVALVAFLAGGTVAARAVRSAFVRGAEWLRTLGDRHGVGTGPVGVWLDQQRVLVRVVIAIGAALALVLAGHLTPKYVLTVAIVAGVLLLIVQLLSRPAEPREIEPAP